VKQQRGGFALGVVLGLLVGLAVALAVALYITKAPIPFVNKVPPRTAEQDTAETERNRNWDPNAPLGGKAAARQAAAATAASASAAPVAPAGPVVAASAATTGLATTAAGVAATAAASASGAAKAAARDPAAILSGVDSSKPEPDPFFYFVQAGAFSRADEADQQRAKLALSGMNAKITEREQAGRTVYRVRLGPFQTRIDADNLQSRLQESSIESQIVRVERP